MRRPNSYVEAPSTPLPLPTDALQLLGYTFGTRSRCPAPPPVGDVKRESAGEDATVVVSISDDADPSAVLICDRPYLYALGAAWSLKNKVGRIYPHPEQNASRSPRPVDGSPPSGVMPICNQDGHSRQRVAARVDSRRRIRGILVRRRTAALFPLPPGIHTHAIIL